MARQLRSWVLAAHNGQQVGSSRMFSTPEVNAYRGAPSCYTFINEVTNKVKNVGACRRGGLRDAAPPAAPTAAAPVPNKPAAAPVAGWWPFSKKKPPAKKNPMARLMIWEPGKPSQMFGRAKRKRRRR